MPLEKSSSNASSCGRSGGLSDLNLLLPVALVGAVALLVVGGVAWMLGLDADMLERLALASGATLLLVFGLLLLLNKASPLLGRLPWLQLDRRMPVKRVIQELRDVTPYLNLLNQQSDGAMRDAEKGVGSIIVSLQQMNDVALKELQRIDQSKLNGNVLLQTVQEKMQLDEQLGMILQMFVARQEQELQESLSRVERLKEVKALEPLIDAVAQVARQTNFLSINAAVEAAHAGHAGRGFAVVAAEIRNLSTQTAATVKDIAAKIEVVTKGVDQELASAQAKTGSNMAAENMRKVLADIEGMKQRFKAAADQNSLDVSHALDTIGHGQRALVELLTEALGNMQFFDVMHQRVGHVREAMDELSEHMRQLADQMCQQHWRENSDPALMQRFDEQTSRYVMHSQLVTHQEVAQGGDGAAAHVTVSNDGGADGSGPKIELF